jgi:hypothetical protein
VNRLDTIIHFHDSEVSRVDTLGDTLRVLFSAACVLRPASSPDGGVEAGYVSGAELRFHGATWSGALKGCVGRLSDGMLMVNQLRHSAVPLPWSVVGAIRAEFRFSNGDVLSVTAHAMVCSARDGARFVEIMTC